MMPLGAPPPLSPEPEPLSPFFDPTCASCGKGDLSTVASKSRGARAGFCPSCGVFLCFEHANTDGKFFKRRFCPSCGRRLRTNTLLFNALLISLVCLLAASLLLEFGFRDVRVGNDERAQMEMAFSDPGTMRPGHVVKISGTVAGSRETPIYIERISTGENERLVWNTYDFNVATANGTVRVRGSLLSDISVSSRQIIGQDGYRGSYNIGDQVVVLGRASGNLTCPEILPQRIAPDNGALYEGTDIGGWLALSSGTLIILTAILSFWALMSRYRSHRKRVWDFKTEASAMPLLSVEGLGAAAPRLPAVQPETAPKDAACQDVELVILSAEGLVEGHRGRSAESEEVVNLLRLAKSFVRSGNHDKAMRYARIAEEKARALR